MNEEGCGDAMQALPRGISLRRAWFPQLTPHERELVDVAKSYSSNIGTWR
jgi:hypothetical protein